MTYVPALVVDHLAAAVRGPRQLLHRRPRGRRHGRLLDGEVEGAVGAARLAAGDAVTGDLRAGAAASRQLLWGFALTEGSVLCCPVLLCSALLCSSGEPEEARGEGRGARAEGGGCSQNPCTPR